MIARQTVITAASVTPKVFVEANMDSNIIDKILSEEKKKLNISLPHNIINVRDYREAFSVNLRENQINITFNESKQFGEKEVRACLRHELCHVLDFLEGRIDSFGITSNPLIHEFTMQIYKAYTDYLMAKRFVNVYNLDYFKIQNEIGMEEFLNNVKNGMRKPNEYYLWIFTLFKEALKTSFYSKADDRFPVGIWKILDWLSEDFDYIDSLKVRWQVKSELLGFETFTILENIDLASIFKQPEPKLVKNDVTFKLYKESPFKSYIFTKNLMERWLQRLSC